MFTSRRDTVIERSSFAGPTCCVTPVQWFHVLLSRQLGLHRQHGQAAVVSLLHSLTMSVTLTLPSLNSHSHTEPSGPEVGTALCWSEWVGRGAIRLPEAAAVWLTRPRVELHLMAVWLFMASSRAHFLTINYYLRSHSGMLAGAGGNGSCSHIQSCH